MKFNWHPSKVAFLDFETQSEEPLTTTHKYATHPSTRVLTCVVKVEDQIHRMGPYLRPDDCEKLSRIASECTLVAHNAPFDAAIWEHAAKLPEATWFDTLPCARAAAYPGKLDDLGRLLTGQGKDPNGKRLIDMLCIVKNGKYPAVGPAHKLLLEYNVRDVELLEQIYGLVHSYGEPDVMSLDRTINDRGLPVDASRLHALVDLYYRNAEIQGNEFRERTGNVNPGSPKQVKDWMRAMGFKVPELNGVESIGKFAYKDFLARTEDFYYGDGDADAAVEAIVELMELRREVVRVGKGKAERAVEALESDSRVRDQFVYYGAHTGRWAGRGMQLHNMPKQELDVRELEPAYEAVVQAAKEASERLGYRVLHADVLNAMLRCVVRADNLLVADYGAVEARGVAWLTDEHKMLKLYSDPAQSVYLDMGEQLFGRRISKKNDPQEYTMAKTLVLGCGYGMSGAKFEYTCKSRGISTAVFDKAGMAAAEAVKVYRTSYPAIPIGWRLLHTALQDAMTHGEAQACKCLLYRNGEDLLCRLPSGRNIVYRNARVEQLVPGYCKLYGMPEVPVDTIVFDLPRMYGDKCKRGFLYGSKLCENIVQAMCRDMLADALLRCEGAGLKPVLHVHDEIVCEASPDRLHDFLHIMSTPPEWAPGFPVLAEGYSGPVWSKISKGYEELNMLNGVQC